ncbi:hypothetical protein KJ662_03630 [Patescibacteria group bacterium]|nr:hypothetical protein [Patescibacteria group bacterium]
MQLRNIMRVATPTLIIVLLIIIFVCSSATHADPGDETVYYFLTDHLGSVDAVLDEQGNVVERRDYLPYGSQRAAETFNGVPITDLGFTGKELDSETGLNYYGARYYDPVTGRFITMDPLLLNLDKMSQAQRNAFLSNPQNLNTYSYVQNNPVRYTDPTGMYEEDVHYDLTYTLALVAGINLSDAREIAYYDQYMDENPDTAPVGGVTTARNYISGTTKNYHFLSRTKALQRVESGIDHRSTQEFGSALHTFQDTYSHSDFIDPAFHVLFGHDPDKTYLNVKLANEAAKASFYQLRNFKLETDGLNGVTLEEFNAQSDLIWNKMAGIVDEYNSLINKNNTIIHAIARGSEQSLQTPKKMDDKKKVR